MKKIINYLLIFAIFFYIYSTNLFAEKKSIILATTTSVQDSGLLDILIPIFERKTGFFVKTIAVGSGQAIMLGKRGEADVLLVHSPEDEIRLVKDGFGINRKIVMYNDFILLGPQNDPANVKGTKNIREAFKKIEEKNALFISRGDNSGTHIKELSIWKELGINPLGKKWYQETGSGMGQTLSVANEKKGYVLTDRGTYLALKKNLNLIIVNEGDDKLKNEYHVIEINPEKFKNINYVGARAFSDFLTSKETQELIKNYGIDKFGLPLFFIK